jgi:hypothetical protein
VQYVHVCGAESEGEIGMTVEVPRAEAWVSNAKCDVCQRERDVSVCSSGLGPLSLAYCAECGGHYAEPEWLLRVTLEETGGAVADWVRRSIFAYRDGEYIPWDEWAASVDERLQGHDPEGHGAKPASAVPAEQGDAQNPSEGHSS